MAIREEKEIKGIQIGKEEFKKIRTIQETSGTTSSMLTFTLQGVSGREESEKGAENLFEEIIAENFTNLGKETDIQFQEAQRVHNKMNSKRLTPRHIIIKMAKIKDKEKNLKAREKQLVTQKVTPMKLLADFSAETLQARRAWNDIFKVMKG